MSTELESIKEFFFSMDYDNIILAISLAESQNISLEPLYNELARVLSDCVFSPNVGWMNLPLHLLIPQLQRIFTISLEYSTLTTLSNTFGFLQGVFLLEILHCDIKTLPDSLQYLKKLRSFSLVDTPIDDLPSTLQELPNLQCLYIRETQITNIPKVIATFSRLHTLDISENKYLEDNLHWHLLDDLPLQKLILDIKYKAQLPMQYEKIATWIGELVE